MKFNLMTVLAGGVAAIALAATPMVIKAQTSDFPGQQFPPPLEAALEELGLTAEQEAQLTQIRQDTRAELESLVTPEQRQQFITTLEQGGSFREAIAAMNLSADQQTQVRSVLRSSRDEVAAVLTQEQREQVRQFIHSRFAGEHPRDRPGEF